MDFDGLLYLDLLSMYRPETKDIAWLKGIRAQIVAKIEAHKNDLGLIAKDRWLLNRIDESLCAAESGRAG